MDMAAATKLMSMQSCMEFTAPTSHAVGVLCFEYAWGMLQQLGLSFSATEESLLQTAIDDKLKGVVACLYGNTVLGALDIFGFQPNIWITCMLIGAALGSY